MKVAIVQIAPVFLDKVLTWEKLKNRLVEAAEEGAYLITWGETLIPGYPQWLSPSGGAEFNNADQKKVYAKYVAESLTLDDTIVTEMRDFCKTHSVMLMGGIAERFAGSLYATLLTIGSDGKILGRHRKIKPTYEERLVWADGDGEGLVVYETPVGKVGGLNCWENWIPYCRAVLHAQEEFLHVAIWPGSTDLTQDISRFMALEGRYYVISAAGLLRPTDFAHLDNSDFPMKDIMEKRTDSWQNGGSIIVGPSGKIIAGPLVDQEGILYADVKSQLVIQERQNFDYSGHYSRDDLFDLRVKRKSS